LEITDAIQMLLEMGKPVKSHILQGWWLDTGTKDDLLQANQFMLENYLDHVIDGTVDANSQINGTVEIKYGAHIIGSTINGPVSIAEHCQIKNSSIGPYASIGKGTTIDSSIIEDSVIMENCRIDSVNRLSDSIIGTGSEIIKQTSCLEPVTLLVGENTRIKPD
jgi:glucose-1-phosphate thymidylyltransferase